MAKRKVIFVGMKANDGEVYGYLKDSETNEAITKSGYWRTEDEEVALGRAILGAGLNPFNVDAEVKVIC